MVFSSALFVFYFLPLALAAYYAAPARWRHPILTALSYVFYGWWNPWFSLLMAGSTVVDYYCGRAIAADGASAGRRRAALAVSVISNLAVLGFFKYAAFLTNSLAGLLTWLHLPSFEPPPFIRTIVLPVGISFYVFQSMSYCIDLYRREAPPARSLGDFACFVSLFPQLVAGPIVRYGDIAAQLRQRDHTVDGFALGAARFGFGFAKKIFLADPAGQVADAAFAAGPGVLDGPSAWLGLVAYAFQIYFDFSAYSDMAIGLGRLFGFSFLENFDSPYRSASLTEFWRRWHISLSSFLRDYLYIPLGGNRLGPSRTVANLLTVMLIGGLWHGAEWTFIAWGGLHGALLALERIGGGPERLYGRFPRPLRVAFVFLVVLAGWVFFRADNFTVAAGFFRALVGAGGLHPASAILRAELWHPGNLSILAIGALVIWAAPNVQSLLARPAGWKLSLGLAAFAAALALMFAQGYSPFLYFQF